MKKIQARLEVELEFSPVLIEIKVVSEKRNRAIFTLACVKTEIEISDAIEVITDFCTKHNLQISRRSLDVEREYNENLGRDFEASIFNSIIQSLEKESLILSLKEERKAYLTKQLASWLNSSMIWEDGSDDYNYCLANAIKISAELDRLG